MKKFTAAVTALHEAETSAKSELQKSYGEYFTAKLNKFGAKSPAELTPEQKSEFFSEISKDWERGVGAKPAGKKDVKEHGVKESEEVNEEKEIKTDAEFKEYAQTVLKKAFADKYDEEKAMKTAEGILKKANGDYGAAVGMLTSSLGESADVNEAATCSMCGKEDCECYKEKDTNESANPLNEATVYISNDKFKDEATLKADILKNVGPALVKLLKDNGINYGPIGARENRGRVEFESKPITGKDLGIMQYGFKEVYINSFGGGSFPQINKAAGDTLEFSPYIWFNLHYSYSHGAAWMNSQGSNGCSFYLPGETTSNIFYDIVGGVFLKAGEAERRSDWK